jgi:predicted DNA-binding transcriptional regulator YafY
VPAVVQAKGAETHHVALLGQKARRASRSSLPESFRATAEAATRAVVVDRAGWDQDAHQRPPPPHLDTVQQAVVEGRQAVLGYLARDGASTVWYLVAGTDRGQRTFRVDRIRSVELSETAVVRPPSFDLAEAWRLIAADFEQARTPVRARAMVDPTWLSSVRWVFAKRARIGPAASDGRVEVELRSPSARALAGEVAEILAGIARELAGLYLGPTEQLPRAPRGGGLSAAPSARG